MSFTCSSDWLSKDIIFFLFVFTFISHVSVIDYLKTLVVFVTWSVLSRVHSSFFMKTCHYCTTVKLLLYFGFRYTFIVLVHLISTDWAQVFICSIVVCFLRCVRILWDWCVFMPNTLLICISIVVLVWIVTRAQHM